MVIPQKEVAAFQKKIFSWYAVNKRDLPWRPPSLNPWEDGEVDPYNVLVSEVMLQQTQVSRVIPKYEVWLTTFPTVEALAAAPQRDVLTMWSGLGYNRRALYLQKTAGVICQEYKGMWPRDIVRLKKLPGIGEYTARAMLSFAFNEQVAVVDTNVRKVIAVEFFQGRVPDEKTLQAVADILLPKRDPARHASRATRGVAGRWNYALMDYAALVLKGHKIPIKKQPAFKGSNRYYRGKVLRLLLEKHTMLLRDLSKQLKKEFAQSDEVWLKTLLLQMESEGFICLNKENITIAEKE